MSGAYFQTFTCTRCGRRFTERMGGFLITERERELKTKPVCNSCRVDQAVDAGMKGLDALKKIVKRERCLYDMLMNRKKRGTMYRILEFHESRKGSMKENEIVLKEGGKT